MPMNGWTIMAEAIPLLPKSIPGTQYLQHHMLSVGAVTITASHPSRTSSLRQDAIFKEVRIGQLNLELPYGEKNR